jgi:hypothetical protein
MSAWLNNRNDLDSDASQSPVFKAMMAKTKGHVEEPQMKPKPQNKPQVGFAKQVRFDMKQPKPYTPTQSSPKGDPSWTMDKLDWSSYAPMAISAIVLGGTYMLSSGKGQVITQKPPPTINLPGLGTF